MNAGKNSKIRMEREASTTAIYLNATGLVSTTKVGVAVFLIQRWLKAQSGD
jgi:hypothetical protein